MRISDWSSDVCSSDLKATTAPSASDAVHALNASSGRAETIQQRSNPGRAWISYMDQTLLEVRVTKKTLEADDIASFELKNCDGSSLPHFSAGSHVDVNMANGLVRQYSLCNVPGETDRYLIAVLRDPNTRGGSAFMHD